MYLDSDHNVAIKSTGAREETFVNNSSQDEVDIEIDLKNGKHKIRGLTGSGCKNHSCHKKKKRKKQLSNETSAYKTPNCDQFYEHQLSSNGMTSVPGSLPTSPQSSVLVPCITPSTVANDKSLKKSKHMGFFNKKNSNKIVPAQITELSGDFIFNGSSCHINFNNN